MMKNINIMNIKTGIVLLTLLVSLIFITSCKKEECGYDKDCPELNLDIGEPCDFNGDGTTDGSVSDFCQCSSNFDCPVLNLNIGDPCDFDGDGVNDGTIDANCNCIPG